MQEIPAIVAVEFSIIDKPDKSLLILSDMRSLEPRQPVLCRVKGENCLLSKGKNWQQQENNVCLGEESHRIQSLFGHSKKLDLLAKGERNNDGSFGINAY